MWVHNPVWHVSLYKGEIWTHTGAQGRHYVKKNAEVEVILSKPSEARRGEWNSFFLALLRRYKPCRYLDLAFLISTAMRQQISIVLNHPICGTLLQKLSKWIQYPLAPLTFCIMHIYYELKTHFFFSTQMFFPLWNLRFTELDQLLRLLLSENILSLQCHLPRCDII